MKTIDEKTIEELKETIPEFVQMVEKVSDKENEIDTVILTLDAFVNESELLYKALWLANSLRVDVTFTT